MCSRIRLDKSYENLKLENPEKLMVDEDHKFIGFDSYKKVLESDVDVVILATPPNFRPGHLEAAVAAGKHIFTEKPVAVDAPGIRRVIESAKQGQRKGTGYDVGISAGDMMYPRSTLTINWKPMAP